MFEEFVYLAPAVANDRTYGRRMPKSVRAKLEEVFFDVRKFRYELWKMKLSSFGTCTLD